MPTPMKQPYTLTTTENPSYGPSYAHGPDAAHIANQFGVPIHFRGQYEGQGEARAWVSGRAVSAEERERILADPDNAPDKVTADAARYRGHILFPTMPARPGSIVEDDPERDCPVVALLGDSDNIRAAALWLDGFLAGQEGARVSGIAEGRRTREKEIAGVVRVLFGDVLKEALTGALDGADVLERIAHSQERR